MILDWEGPFANLNAIHSAPTLSPLFAFMKKSSPGLLSPKPAILHCLSKSFSLQERRYKALGEQLLLSLHSFSYVGEEDTGRAQRLHFIF